MKLQRWGMIASISIYSVACEPSPKTPLEIDRAPERRVTIEFTGVVDSAAGTIELKAIHGTTRSSLDPANVVQDGVVGSGPLRSVELVTSNVRFDAACGFAASFCADVTVRSFYDGQLDNVAVQLTRITPAAGHLPLNSNGNFMELVDQFGIWVYGFLPALGGSATRTWVFGDDGTAFTIRGVVMADLPDGSSATRAGVSCRALLGNGVTADGEYWINPGSPDPADAFQVFCDMTQHDGGWTYIGRGEWYLMVLDSIPPGSAGQLSTARIDRITLASDRLYRVGRTIHFFIDDPGALIEPGLHYWRSTSPTRQCAATYADVTAGMMTPADTRNVDCDPLGVGAHQCGSGNGWILLHDRMGVTSGFKTYNFGGTHPLPLGPGDEPPAGTELLDLAVR